MKGRLGVLAAILLTVGACSGADNVMSADEIVVTPIEAESAVIPSGYEQFNGDGFTVAVPAEWVSLGPDDLDFGEVVDAGVEEAGLEDEFLAEAAASAFEQGGLLMAFDFVNSSPSFVDNINVIRLPSSPLSPSGMAEVTEAQYEAFGATDVGSELVTVPAGQGAVITYTLPQFGNEGISLIVLGEEYDWVVTISASDLVTATIDADVVFDSFRIVP
jgi:hypothetical protein